MYKTANAVHLDILRDAEIIANRLYEESRSGFGQGQIFRADPIQSTKGGLCLSIDEVVAESLDQDEVVEAHQIGVEAIRQSILKNYESFVGLILGDARNGRNYFDRF